MNDIVALMRAKLRSRVTDQDDVISPSPAKPTNKARLAEDEAVLGFRLPADLKHLYCEIGNGGFGPGYGLIGLSDGKPDDTGKTSIELYRLYKERDPEDRAWSWPNGLLPICNWGCAIYSCIDCLDPSFRMRVFDPNAHLAATTWDDAFFDECDSFSTWISDWCIGINLWDRMYGDEGLIATQLATRKRH